MRFLLQAQFSATDEDIAAVRAKGYAAWLAEQFAQPIGTTGTDWLAQRGYGVANADTRYHNTSYPADYMLWSQLFTERDAVRKRVALALSEIMVVSTNGLNQPWPAFLAAGYWDVLNQHALGNFRALLEAVTLNPAMGVYLNALGSQKEDARTGRQPDENYAREVMQLFTLGLYRLNADGTEQRDASGNRIETYGPSDVSNLARVFTGYDYDRSQNQSFTVGTSTVPGPQQAGRPMVLVASRHSALAATFLGTTIGAGTPGDAALKTALDTLFNHPNVAPFIGRQLIQRLVTSNPSPAYVARVAAAFSDNGSGVRGDLRAVVAAILLDSEARDAAGLSSPSFGRLREPMVRFVQWGRTFGLRSARGSWKLGDLSDPASRLGQSPAALAFGVQFLPPRLRAALHGHRVRRAGGAGVPDRHRVQRGRLPELHAERDPQRPVRERSRPAAEQREQRQQRLRHHLRLCRPAPAGDRSGRTGAQGGAAAVGGQISDATQARIANALAATPVTASSSAAAKLNRVAAAVFLVMACPAYLVQK